MATIAPTDMSGSAGRPMVETVMTASDTLTYKPGRNQTLILRNQTAGPLTVTIDGADGTTVPVPGVGPVSVAAGYSTGVIAATSGRVAIPLDSIYQYLQGIIALTGGTGIIASLLEF